MKKPLFGKAKRQSDEMSLQITSMADIFTILLVFLLKSYASGATSIAPSPGTVLPTAQSADMSSVEALKVEISSTAVQVEGVPVTQLSEFKADAKDLKPNGMIQSLSEAIDKHRQRQLVIAKANPDVKVDAKVIVIADQHAPYSTVKSVLASAAVHGYTDFKLAVVSGE